MLVPGTLVCEYLRYNAINGNVLSIILTFAVKDISIFTTKDPWMEELSTKKLFESFYAVDIINGWLGQ